nr:hypothetical protein TDPV-176 [Oriental turtle dovepox virus]
MVFYIHLYTINRILFIISKNTYRCSVGGVR